MHIGPESAVLGPLTLWWVKITSIWPVAATVCRFGYRSHSIFSFYVDPLTNCGLGVLGPGCSPIFQEWGPTGMEIAIFRPAMGGLKNWHLRMTSDNPRGPLCCCWVTIW